MHRYCWVLVVLFLAASAAVDVEEAEGVHRRKQPSCLWRGVGKTGFAKMSQDTGLSSTYELTSKDKRFVKSKIEGQTGQKLLDWYKSCCWDNDKLYNRDEGWLVKELGWRVLGRDSDKMAHFDFMFNHLRKTPTLRCQLMDEAYFLKIARRWTDDNIATWFNSMNKQKRKQILDFVSISAGTLNNDKDNKDMQSLHERMITAEELARRQRAIERVVQAGPEKMRQMIVEDLRGYDPLTGQQRRVSVSRMVKDLAWILWESRGTGSAEDRKARRTVIEVIQGAVCDIDAKRRRGHDFPLFKLQRVAFQSWLDRWPGVSRLRAVFLGAWGELHPYSGLTPSGYLMGDSVDNSLGWMGARALANDRVAARVFYALAQYEEEFFPHAVQLAFYHITSAEIGKKQAGLSTGVTCGAVAAGFAKTVLDEGKNTEFKRAFWHAHMMGKCLRAAEHAIELVIKDEKAKTEAGAMIIKYSAKALDKLGVKGAEKVFKKGVDYVQKMENAQTDKLMTVYKSDVLRVEWEKILAVMKPNDEQREHARVMYFNQWQSAGYDRQKNKENAFSKHRDKRKC